MNIPIDKFDVILKDPRCHLLLKLLGPELYAVGGAIRDLLLDRPVKDIDFTTNLSPDAIITRISGAGIRIVPTGLHHQTVTVVFETEGSPVEITSFRNSNMTPDHGLHLGLNILEDLNYRDFSCNAMALKISDGSFIDSNNGLNDIHYKIIRSVGNPIDRFQEDPLRILRMARLAAQLDFEIDSHTFSVAKDLAKTISKVSTERVRDEFLKILLASNVRLGLKLLKDLQFFKEFIPELQICTGFEQNKFHSKDVFEHTLDVVELADANIISKLASLLHDIGKPPSLSVSEDGERHFYLHEKIGADITENILNRLLLPKATIKAVKQLVYTHMRPISAGSGGLRRILRDTEPYYEEWRNLKEADTVAVLGASNSLKKEFIDFDLRMNEIKNSQNGSIYKNIAINGHDLKQLGIPEGPIYKKILSFCQELVIDEPEKNSREILENLVKMKFLAKIDNL